MKRILLSFLCLGFLLQLGACGPNCIEEERQLNDCVNLTVLGTLSCNQTAQSQADAASRQAGAALCLNGTIAGLLGCSTQVHPYCTY